MSDYLPNSESELVIWANDHAAGVSTHGANVGLSAGDITQAATDATLIGLVVNGRSLYESNKQEFTAYKDIALYAPLNTPLPALPSPPSVGVLPAGALAACVARARQRAERIKAHPNYTVAIGEDCRIVSPPPAPSSGTEAPTLTATALTDFQVRINFVMRGHDQIEIQSKRGDEAAFTTLAFDTNNPYLDARETLGPHTPELREYRARYRDGDVPGDTWSDIVSVTAQS